MRRPITTITAVGVSLLLLTGCTQAARSAVPPTSPAPSASVSESTTVTFAAVGDSLTAGQSAAFAQGSLDPGTWVSQLPGDRLVFKGGWAVPGSTTQQMRDGVAPVDADLLIVMAGTNDVGLNVPLATSEANLEAIVRIVGGRTVVISAIPPSNTYPTQAAAYNQALESFARVHGWHWVDPWAQVRDGEVYKQGATLDGVHPVPDAARIVGQVMRDDLLKSVLPAR